MCQMGRHAPEASHTILHTSLWCAMLFIYSSVCCAALRQCQRAHVGCSCLSAGMFFLHFCLRHSHYLSSSLLFLSPWFFFPPLFLHLSLELNNTGRMAVVTIDLNQLFFSSSLFFPVCLFSALALWFMGSLWGEATGDPVWLQNSSKIRRFMVPHRDHRQIQRLSASSVHVQRRTHIYPETHPISGMYIYSAARSCGVSTFVKKEKLCILT